MPVLPTIQGERADIISTMDKAFPAEQAPRCIMSEDEGQSDPQLHTADHTNRMKDKMSTNQRILVRMGMRTP